jgi:hypothetical protein
MEIYRRLLNRGIPEVISGWHVLQTKNGKLVAEIGVERPWREGGNGPSQSSHATSTSQILRSCSAAFSGPTYSDPYEAKVVSASCSAARGSRSLAFQTSSLFGYVAHLNLS